MVCRKDSRVCPSFAKSYAHWPKTKCKCRQGAEPQTDFITFFSLLKMNHRKVGGTRDVHKVEQNIPI